MVRDAISQSPTLLHEKNDLLLSQHQILHFKTRESHPVPLTSPHEGASAATKIDFGWSQPMQPTPANNINASSTRAANLPRGVTPREDVPECAQESVLGERRHNRELFGDPALDVNWRFLPRRIVAVVQLHVQLLGKRAVDGHGGGGGGT